MSYEEESASIVRIPLFTGKDGTDYWADVQLISKRDEDGCRAALLGKRTHREKVVISDGGRQSETEEEFDDAAYTDEILVRGIVEWNLTGRDGAVWPIDRAHVAKLRGPHANKLIKAIRDLGDGISPQPASSG